MNNSLATEINAHRLAARIHLWQTIAHNDYSSETRNNTSRILYGICHMAKRITSMMYEKTAYREVYTVAMKDS